MSEPGEQARLTTKGIRSWLDLAVDVLIASSLAAGLTEAIYYFRGLSGSLWLALVYSLAVTLLLAIASRRWWLIPVVAGLPLVLAILVLWRINLLGKVWLLIMQYSHWAADWLIFGQPPPPALFWLTVLKFVITVPLCVICLTLVRRIIWLSIYAGLIALIYIPLLIYYPDAVPALLLALGGLVLMLPRRFLERVQAERPRDISLPRAPLQILAIPATIISLVLAQVIVPTNTTEWKLPALVNRINDLTDLWQNRLGKGRPRSLFDISDQGFQPAGARLGGPVILSDKLFLKVIADKPVLLKGSTRAIYTGSSWLNSFNPSYRLDSNLWWQVRRNVFDRGIPTGATASNFLAMYSTTLQLVVTPETTRQTTLFATGRVDQVSIPLLPTLPPYFTSDGSLFVWQDLPPNSSYVIVTDFIDRSAQGFDYAMINLEKNVPAQLDRNWAAVVKEYLQLPADLPPDVAAAAKDIAGTAASPYQKALALEKYLQTQFNYSLDPGFVPVGTDFVTYFLKSKTGYCVYFATALAVMARTLGIPSRYVEGFALIPGSSSQEVVNNWIATGETAHAWVELYFQGIGWLTFDPTPGVYINPDGGHPSITPSIGPSSPPASPTPIPTEPQPPPPGQPIPPLALILPALLILSVLLSFAYVQARHARRLSRSAIIKRFPDPARQLEYLYRDILVQMDCINVYPEPGETLAAFAERAERYFRLEGLSVTAAFWPVSRWLYGGISPSDTELSLLNELHIRAENRLKESLSSSIYFFRRVLGPSVNMKTQQTG